ncbi:MAG: 2-hydroxyacyl-CoA dehydratase, partial [Desulfobacterales bacterium]|nr:2-hydroxyacyl-CoA dehydratase [Desulfobacterales bacterium]
MNELMTPFREVLEDRHGWIKDYKSKSDRQLCGYFCDYVPEELLWAAGMTTIRITGGSGNVTAADKHMQSNVCSFARRCFDQALEGVFDYLDGLVIPHTCDIMTRMYDLWAYRLKKPEFLHYLWLPHKVFDPSTEGLMTGEVNRLKKCIEEHIGKEISNESIKEAILLFNKS